MILAGLIVSSFNGKITTLSDTILSSSKEAVELCILMFGIVGLWSGLMNIALSLGITTQLQKLLTPFLTFLFPNLKNQKAKEYISTNIVANILGLGWAATPSGLKAMEELQKDNPDKNTATNEMCSFLILNISSLQLIPINIIAYRSQYGSVNPSKILIPGLIARFHDRCCYLYQMEGPKTMITFLANLVIPLFIFTLVLYGTLKRKDIYTPFLEGVMDGFKIVLEIAPTLIALFFAIQIFRSSGALDLIVRFLTPMGKLLKIPKEVLPVIFAKLFSSSAATGFLLDIYKTSGPDSLAGFMSSVILSSTETCFYTLSVYYSVVGIEKIRYTLTGALLAVFVGTFISVFISYL